MKKFIKVFDNLTLIFISLIFFLAPLFFLGLTNKGLGFEKNILFGVLLSLALVFFFARALVEKKLVLKRTPLDFFWLFLLVVYFFSSLFSVGIKDSLIGSSANISRGFLFLISIILFYYLLVNNINLKRFKIWFISFLSSFSLIIIYSFLQIINIFFFPSNFFNSIPLNPIGSTLNLVIFLVISLPLFMISVIRFKELFSQIKTRGYFLIKPFLTLVLFLNLALLFLLKNYISLAVWLIVFLGIFLILSLFIGNEKKGDFKKLIIPFLSLVAVIIVLLIPSPEKFNYKLPIESSLSPSVSWDISRLSLRNDLLLGSGPSTFYYTFSRYRGVEFNDFNLGDFWMERAGGLMFDYFSTVGILGAFGFLAIIIFILFNSFTLVTKNFNKGGVIMIFGFSVSLLSLYLLSLFLPINNSIYLILYLLIALLASSFVLFYSAKELREKTITINSFALVSSFSFLVLIFSFILFVGGTKMFTADLYAGRANFNERLDDKIDNLEKAVKWFSYEDSYYYELADKCFSKAIKGASENNSELVRLNLNKSLVFSHRAVALSPNKVPNIKQAASLYENAYIYSKDYLDITEKYYEKYKNLEPSNVQPFLKSALVKMAQADLVKEKNEKEKYLDEALDNYSKAIERKSDLDLLYYGKAMVFEEKGDFVQAINEAEKSLAIKENNIDYLIEIGRLYFNKAVVESNLDLKEINMENLHKDLEFYRLDHKIEWNEDLAKAEEYFLKSLELNSEYGDSLYYLAFLYLKTDKVLQAKEYYDKLLEEIDDEELKESIRVQVGKFFN